MSTIVFIDTSILCNLIPVPGRSQHEAEVRKELAARQRRGEQFILPITAVIETGNFIAQLKDGSERRTVSEKMENILRYICEGKTPWVLHDVAWNRGFLLAFLDGAGTQMSYSQHAQNRMGAGDLCILTERQHYQDRTRIKAEVWTLDDGLNAHV